MSWSPALIAVCAVFAVVVFAPSLIRAMRIMRRRNRYRVRGKHLPPPSPACNRSQDWRAHELTPRF